MSIIETPKSRTDHICAIDVSGEISFNASEERRIRSLISGHIKSKYPLRVFTTSVNKNALIVKREADLIKS